MDQLPYRRIAVASTFSPRFEQVLAEAKRVRDRFGAELHLIYVGRRSDETDARFAEAFAALGLPADAPIHYQEGEHPAEAILQAMERNAIELIVAGALEKAAVVRSFLGNVARQLVREAPCSVFLFTKPAREPQPLRRIAFFVPNYSEHAARALRQAVSLAEAEKCEHLYVIRVYSSFDAARATLRANQEAPEQEAPAPTFEEEEAALEHFLADAVVSSSVPIEPRSIRSNTGFAASDFVQSVECDLLVVPVEATEQSDGLPGHIAWVTDVIPCNLWVIR